MIRDRKERLKEALLRWEQTPAEERDAFWAALEAEDSEVAREARILVAQPTVRPLETGAMAAAGADAVRRIGEEAAAGRQVGPYTLVEVIGVGGMGAVYRAEQREPVRREVAVKLLVGGVSLGRIAERFAAEQKALALMDHPGIARLLDAGADSTGTPYIAMELVRGTPITRYCRDRGLPRREVLDLFVAICRATQHAHLKGIIHRDLKPSNILVAEVDGRPTVKIIDFGIARIVEGPDGSGPMTQLTGEGQIVGTLEYMSPEQAEGRAREIDLRTDVYSLGAVLYELLIGSLPYDLTGLTLTQAIDVIRREAPQPFRRTRATGRRIDDDLETIARKALGKEPARRYDGAGALADDVDRYLRSEPIVARPPSTAYQFRTMMKRNRRVVITGAAAFVFLAIFGVTMTVLYAGQSRERERAESEARKAEAVSDFLQRMLASANPTLLGRDATVREVTDQSLRELGTSFPRHPDVHAVIEGTLGRTYASLGQMNRADSLLRVAHGRHSRAKGDHDLGSLAILRERVNVARELNRLEEADSLGQEAVRLAREATGDKSLETARSLHVLGWSQVYPHPARSESLLTEAERIARAHPNTRALRGEILSALATAVGLNDRAPEAERHLLLSIQLLEEEYGPMDYRLAGSLSTLGDLLQHQARHEEAIAANARALALAEPRLGPDHPEIAVHLNNVAVSHMLAGNYAAADTLMQRAARIFLSTYGETHPHVQTAYNNIGYIQCARVRFDEAIRWYSRAVVIAERLGTDQTRDALAPYTNLVDLQFELGRMADATVNTRKIARIVAELEVGGRPVLPFAYGTLGRCYWELGEYAASERNFRRALENMTAGNANGNSVEATRTGLALTLHRLGQTVAADSILRESGPAIAGSTENPVIARSALKRLIRHYREVGDEERVAFYRAAEAKLPR